MTEPDRARTSRRAFMHGALVGGAAVLLAVPGGALADASPQAFLLAIYAAYGKGGEGIALNDRATLHRYFVADLADLIGDDADRAAASEDAPMLDSDPFVNAQDFEITDLAITIDDTAGGRTVGHVAFANFGEPTTIDIELEETADGWRIHDILWPDSSLRGLYTH